MKLFEFDAIQNVLLGKHKKMSQNIQDLVKDLHNNQCAVWILYSLECLKAKKCLLRQKRLETSTDLFCLEQYHYEWTIYYAIHAVSRTCSMCTHLLAYTEMSLWMSTLCDSNRSCELCSTVNLTITLATAQPRNRATAASKLLTIWHNQNALSQSPAGNLSDLNFSQDTL